MNNTATAATLTLAALATVSHAGIMQITSDTRDLSASMSRWLEFGDDNTLEQWGESDAYNGSQPGWSSSITHTNETSVFDASHNSSSTTNQLSVTGGIDVTSSNPSGFYGTVWNSASSDYRVNFTLTEDTEFAYDVDLLGTGNIETHSILSSTDGGGFYSWTGFFGQVGADRHEQLHETFMLSAGSYNLTVFNEILIDEVTPNFVGPLHSAGDFDVQLTIIPAPSTLAFLSLSGCLATRRRR